MTNASFTDDIQFLGDLARLRLSAADYLVHGRLWRPPSVTTVSPASGMPTVTVCDWGDAFSAGTPHCCNMSAVLASAWLSPTGEIALVMANHHTLTVSVTIDVALPAVQLTAHGLGPEASKEQRVLVTDGVAQVQRTLLGRSAAVLVLG